MLDTLAIDISRYQPRIDPAPLISGGVRLVITKAAQACFADAKFRQHTTTLAPTPLIQAAYGWPDPIAGPPEPQADFLLDTIAGSKFRFIAVDIEQWWADWDKWLASRSGGYKGVVPRLSPDVIGRHVDGYVDRLCKKSSLPIIAYTSPGFVSSYCPNLFTKYLGPMDTWLAQYLLPQPTGEMTWAQLRATGLPTRKPTLPNGIGRLVGWQFTGDHVRCPGVFAQETGTKLSTLDVNLWDGAWLAEITGSPLTPPPAPAPAPAAKIETGTVFALPWLNVRTDPNTTSAVIGQKLPGSKVKIEKISGKWGKLHNEPGWVCLDWVRL